MFRATLLSIVLTFAAGPSVSLLCAAWCDPETAAERGCHDGDHSSTTSVQSSHDCQDHAFGDIAAVKESSRRGTTPDTQGHAIPLPHYQVAVREAATHRADRRGPAPPIQTRPLSTPLRI